DYNGLDPADVTVVNVDNETPEQPTVATVSSISYATTGGRQGDKHLVITVKVEDDLGGLVGGASVSIVVSLDGATYTTLTGSTAPDGTVSFTLNNAPAGLYTTLITNLTADELTWDGLTPENGFQK
ncbi:MAG: hypothetical protein AMS16_04965, partial [Planctomycetes bacterium DG_58]